MTGPAAIAAPSPVASQQGALPSLWRLLGVVLGSRRPLAVQPVLSALLAVLDTVILVALVRLAVVVVDDSAAPDWQVAGRSFSIEFNDLAWLALAAIAVCAVARTAEARVAAANATRAVEHARSLVLTSWFESRWERTRGERLGRLQQLLATHSQQAAVPVQLFSTLTTSGLTLLLYLSIVLATAPVVAISLAVAGAAIAAVFRPLRLRAKRAARTHADQINGLQLTATSYALLNRELHAFGVQHQANERLNRESQQAAAAFRHLRFLQRMTPGLYQLALLAAVIGLLAISRKLGVSATGFGTSAILAVRSLSFVQQINNQLQSYVETRPYLEDLAATIGGATDAAPHRGAAELGRVDHLQLDAVDYSYEGVPALSGVSLEVTAGDWIGIVGPSGGGKTTLANILVGLTAPTRGSYLVNGEPSTAYSAASWCTQFSLLSQEAALLRATAAENIDFHRDIPAAKLRDAARSAIIEPDLDRLPAGFDTELGDGHASLSGGQRQRLALARAMAANPSCLILDEPTSALDAENERLVEESLRALPRDTIVVVISHRPALLDRCTRCFEVRGGRLVQLEGRPEAPDADAAGTPKA